MRKALVVAPATLCANWGREVKKWLGSERLRCMVFAPQGAQAKGQALDFARGSVWKLLIGSYEVGIKLCWLRRRRWCGGGKEAGRAVGVCLARTPTAPKPSHAHAQPPFIDSHHKSLRKHAPVLAGCCDLLVCDEGHRLKSAGGNKTIDALLSLGCARRVVLTSQSNGFGDVEAAGARLAAALTRVCGGRALLRVADAANPVVEW